MSAGHEHHHGHHDDAGDDGIPPWPHKPVPPEPKRLLPERPLLVRGLGLAALAGTLGFAGFRVFRSHAVLGALPALVLEAGALLAAWAAAIHLTGGERFDDHPWV